MNPLDLPGPAFLVFYLAYGGIVFLLAEAAKRLLEYRGQPLYPGQGVARYPKEEEAYRLALLRGGRQEVVRTLFVRLQAGDLVVVGPDSISPDPTANTSAAKLDDFERTALEAMGTLVPAPAQASAVELALDSQLGRMEEELRRDGLLRRADELWPFHTLRVIALALTCGMGVVKLGVALSRDRTNVGFLITLIVAYGVGGFAFLTTPRVSRAGGELLKWLRQSHEGLKTLVLGGQRTTAGELALVSAIYGFGALAAAPMIGSLSESLRPKRDSGFWGQVGCGGGGCGGGGCGGGGCGGGGCGGCGG